MPGNCNSLFVPISLSLSEAPISFFFIYTMERDNSTHEHSAGNN